LVGVLATHAVDQMSDYFSSLIGVVCGAGVGSFVALAFTVWVTKLIDRLMDEAEEATE